MTRYWMFLTITFMIMIPTLMTMPPGIPIGKMKTLKIFMLTISTSSLLNQYYPTMINSTEPSSKLLAMIILRVLSYLQYRKLSTILIPGTIWKSEWETRNLWSSQQRMGTIVRRLTSINFLFQAEGFRFYIMFLVNVYLILFRNLAGDQWFISSLKNISVTQNQQTGDEAGSSIFFWESRK